MNQRVLSGAAVATMNGEGYGLIPHGYVVIDGDRIAWAGAELPVTYHDWPLEDLGGGLITPALIDCHTHLVFGGNRAREFEMRLNGRYG